MREWLGLAGLLLIIIGWGITTIETIKKRSSSVPFALACFYFAGSFLLAIYSFLLNDLIFILLNAAATLVALINIHYSIKAGKKKR